MCYVVPFSLPEWSYSRALEELHSALRFGIEPLIETVIDMLAELDNPDQAFSALQVAGTNGKTSTSRYTAAILSGEGFRVGLYTSPELVSYTERIEVDGAPIDEVRFAHGIAAASEAGRRLNLHRIEKGLRPYDITEFDLLTVAACVIFAEAKLDVVVFEVGMGGRWDATSAVSSIRSVAITGIGLDHMHVLGETLEAIAAEKAAVIKSGRDCILGVGTASPTSVERVFLDRAADVDVTPILLRPAQSSDAPEMLEDVQWTLHPELPGASYSIVRRPKRLGDTLILDVVTSRSVYRGVAALKPAYQAANIACAIALAEQFLDRVLDADRLETSITCCPTPGRFDLIRPQPPALIDACHNPQSVRVFLGAIRAIEPIVSRRPTLLVAALADKDVQGMVKLLSHEFPTVRTTQTSSSRALSAHELARLFRDAGGKVVGEYRCVSSALETLSDTPFVACGSITLAGELTAHFRHTA